MCLSVNDGWVQRLARCARIGLQCWALLSLRITSSREYGLCEGLWSGICKTHSNVSHHSFARSGTSSSTQISDGLQVRTRQLWGSRASGFIRWVMMSVEKLLAGAIHTVIHMKLIPTLLRGFWLPLSNFLCGIMYITPVIIDYCSTSCDCYPKEKSKDSGQVQIL